MFSARISNDVRWALERESRRTGESLSHIVQQRLAESYALPGGMKKALGPDHIRALAYLVADIAKTAERTCVSVASGAGRWNEDPYTSDVVSAAIGLLLERLRPSGDVVVPDKVAKNAEYYPDPENYSQPKSQGYGIALGILDKPETLKDKLPKSRTEHFALEFDLYPEINKFLKR